MIHISISIHIISKLRITKKSQNPSPPPTVEARRVRGRERETLDQGGSGLRGDLRCLGGNHGGDVGTYC